MKLYVKKAQFTTDHLDVPYAQRAGVWYRVYSIITTYKLRILKRGNRVG